MRRLFRTAGICTTLGALALLAAAAWQTDISGPSGSGSFGAAVTLLSNGNLVISDPGYDVPGASDIGAVYLYDGGTGAQISALTGSTAGDQIGSAGITVLANGSFVVSSPYWDNGSAADAGAVTWGSASTGASGVVSSANSLVGASADDRVGDDPGSVVALANGNYLVLAPDWDNGALVDAGAVAWGSGASGISGSISAANSLAGGSAGDSIGAPGSVSELPGGNYLVLSPEWDSGALVDAGASVDAGAVTWGSGSAGVRGLISAANSLVGSAAYDQAGSIDAVLLPNGNYVVQTPFWDNGAALDAGAVTWGSGASGISGPISAANSLVGSSLNDRTGSAGSVSLLANGSYLVSSRLWDNGAAADAGAVTWGSAVSGVSGAISAANSLVGSASGDGIGSPGSIVELSNGNFVVISSLWDNGAAVDAGAVTWVNGSLGIRAAISPANSLVGGTAGDRVGFGGVLALADGDYVVQSPLWDNGSVTDAGAVTWANGSAGVSGAVSTANSLAGSSAGDSVGYAGSVVELASGSFVVITTGWDNGAVVDAGAATWVNGASSIAGELSPASSLVGSSANDRIGSGGVAALSNGSYVVHSPEWDNAKETDAGAVTWGSSGAGAAGVVSAANSLVGGLQGDQVGGRQVVELANGNFVALSPEWDHYAVLDAGAATWGSGNTGIAGAVSNANSLVGVTAGDHVGSGVLPLANGNYVVCSPDWDNGAVQDTGAATWANGASGAAGLVSPANSLVGSSPGDAVGDCARAAALANGNYVLRSPDWDSGAAINAGAVTWGSGASGASGLVSTANSLVGSHTNDLVGFYTLHLLANGNFVVGSPDWDNDLVEDAGAATWVNGATGLTGAISAANSLVGSTAWDAVGNPFNMISLAVGDFLVCSPDWDNGVAVDAGAITWVSGATGVTGQVSAANSLVGSASYDSLGNPCSAASLANGAYLILSPGWDNGPVLDAGAVTWGEPDGAARGPVTADNSVVGLAPGGGASMHYAFEDLLAQLIVGRPAENIVTLRKQAPLNYQVRLPALFR